MTTQPAISYSIVVIGNFNPVIFQTEWLRRYKILPEQEITASLTENVVAEPTPNVQIIEGYRTFISPQKTELNFPSYKLLVLPVRFQFSTQKKDCSLEMVGSTIKMFELLSHTPITAIGINFNAHLNITDCDRILMQLFNVNSEKAKGIFGEGYKVGGKFFIERAKYKIRVVIEPSEVIKDGIYVAINFHRKIESRHTDELLPALRNYENDVKEAEKITQHLLNLKEAVFI